MPASSTLQAPTPAQQPTPPTTVAPPPSKRLRRWLIWGTVLSMIAGVIWWETDGEYRFVPKRFGVVVPGKIYRSGQTSKWCIEEVLVQHKIEAIIDFTGFDWNDEHQQAELKAAWKHGIAVSRFPQSGDGTGDINRYALALKTLCDHEKAGRPVLVHCAAGSQRTGAAIAFYRVLIQKKTTAEAIHEMRRYDCEPKNNQRLVEFMNTNMQQLAEELVTLKVIDHVPNPLPKFVP